MHCHVCQTTNEAFFLVYPAQHLVARNHDASTVLSNVFCLSCAEHSNEAAAFDLCLRCKKPWDDRELILCNDQIGWDEISFTEETEDFRHYYCPDCYGHVVQDPEVITKNLLEESKSSFDVICGWCSQQFCEPRRHYLAENSFSANAAFDSLSMLAEVFSLKFYRRFPHEFWAFPGCPPRLFFAPLNMHRWKQGQHCPGLRSSFGPSFDSLTETAMSSLVGQNRKKKRKPKRRRNRRKSQRTKHPTKEVKPSTSLVSMKPGKRKRKSLPQKKRKKRKSSLPPKIDSYELKLPPFRSETKRAFTSLNLRLPNRRYESNTLHDLLDYLDKHCLAWPSRKSFGGVAWCILKHRGQCMAKKDQNARQTTREQCELMQWPQELEALLLSFVGSFSCPESIDDLLYLLFTTRGSEDCCRAIRIYQWKWPPISSSDDPRRGLVIDFPACLIAMNFARRLQEALPCALPIRAQNHSSFRYTVQQCSPGDFEYCYDLTQYEWPQFERGLEPTSGTGFPHNSTALRMEQKLRRILTQQEAKRFRDAGSITFDMHCARVLGAMSCLDMGGLGPPRFTESLLVIWAKAFLDLRLHEAMHILRTRIRLWSDSHRFTHLWRRLHLMAMFPLRERSLKEPFVRHHHGYDERVAF